MNNCVSDSSPDEPIILARPAGGFAGPPLARAIPVPVLPPPEFPFVDMPRRLAFWDAACALALWLAYAFLIFCSGVAFLLSTSWPPLGFLSVNVLLGVFALFIVLGVIRFRRQSVASLGLNRPDAARLILGTILAVPAAYAASTAANLLYMSLLSGGFDALLEERSELFAMMPELSFGTIVVFSLFVGFHEEVFFRGFLLTRLTVGLRSRAAAVAVTSVIFGLLHAYQGPAGILQTTFLGAVLGIVVCVTRTLWPAILAHAFFNIVGLVLMPWLAELSEELPAAAGG